VEDCGLYPSAGLRTRKPDRVQCLGFIQFLASTLQFVAHPEDQCSVTQERSKVDKQSGNHGWIESRSFLTKDYRLRMLRAPPSNRHVHNGNIDKTEDS